MAISGCKKEDMVYYIKSNPQELHFSNSGGLDTVAITSNSGWTVSVPLGWCKTSLTSVETSVKTVFLGFSVEKNPTTQARSQDVIIRSKSNNSIQSVIKIFQEAGEDPDDPDDPEDPDTADTLFITPSVIEIPCKGGNYNFTLGSDTTWTYQGSNASWCNLVSEQLSGSRGEYQMTLSAGTSKHSQSRTAVLTFKTSNDSLAYMEVTQRPLGISVIEDLLLFRDDVNAFADLRPWMDSDSTIHLLSDLDLSGIPNWIPIGLHTNAMLFSDKNSSIAGVFNGNNHTISNLSITQTDYRSAGLFGYVKKAIIQDLTLDQSCSITLETGQYQDLSAGGICGTLLGGTLSGCHFQGTIRLTGLSTTTATGGITGEVNTDASHNASVISDCSNNGTLQGLSPVGGIAAKLIGSSITACQNNPGALVKGTGLVGGISGLSWTKGIIENSHNQGRVEGTAEKTGGICGEQFNLSRISNCVNHTGAMVTGTSRLGGICGYSASSCSIKNCINETDITGISETGGICGTQFLSCSTEGCSNSGDIAGSGTNNNQNTGIGGIVGGNFGSEIISSENSGTVTGQSTVGGVAGYTNYVIKDCINLAAIEGGTFIGGLAGMAEGTGYVISFLTNSGTVTASGGAGGIIGNITNSISVSFCTNQETGVVYASAGTAGGIVGTVNNTAASVSDCENHAPVSSEKWAGGIVALSQGKILNCLNTGQVSVPLTNNPVQNEEGYVVEDITLAGGVVAMTSSSVENCENQGVVSGYTAGGIVSRFTSSVSLYKVKNCKNSGQVTGTRSAAGVAATITKGGTAEAVENSGSVTGPYCVGGVVAENVKGSLINCVNSGPIKGSETETDDKFFALGGICGMNDSGNMTNCSNSGTVTRYGETGIYRYVGGMVGVTARATGTGGLLKGCSNSGPVSGYVSDDPLDYCYLGGFCGLFASGPAPEDCTNTGTVNGQPASDENMYGGTN